MLWNRYTYIFFYRHVCTHTHIVRIYIYIYVSDDAGASFRFWGTSYRLRIRVPWSVSHSSVELSAWGLRGCFALDLAEGHGLLKPWFIAWETVRNTRSTCTFRVWWNEMIGTMMMMMAKVPTGQWFHNHRRWRVVTTPMAIFCLCKVGVLKGLLVNQKIARIFTKLERGQTTFKSAWGAKTVVNSCQWNLPQQPTKTDPLDRNPADQKWNGQCCFPCGTLLSDMTDLHGKKSHLGPGLFLEQKMLKLKAFTSWIYTKKSCPPTSRRPFVEIAGCSETRVFPQSKSIA